MKLSLGYTEPDRECERWVTRRNAWLLPRLPEAGVGRPARSARAGTWTPPGTMLLVRHRSDDGKRCIITNDRLSPPGYSIEYDLGMVRIAAELGTKRLLSDEDGHLFTTQVEGVLAAGYRALGYIEQAPLPLLDALELRVDPSSDLFTLVAGPCDPLYDTARPVATLGFLDSYPINPRDITDPRITWRVSALVRAEEPNRWRHLYSVTEQPGADVVSLGGVRQEPAPGLIALCREGDGRLTSELLPSWRAHRLWRARAKWAAAPLNWAKGKPENWALRATGGRIRALASQRSPGEVYDPAVLGYLRRTPGQGWAPLFSASHPALGDQYLTRSEIEAIDLGYRVDGVIGYIMDVLATRRRDELPSEVKWGSRFGQHRRYFEGHVVSPMSLEYPHKDSEQGPRLPTKSSLQ